MEIKFGIRYYTTWDATLLFSVSLQPIHDISIRVMYYKRVLLLVVRYSYSSEHAFSSVSRRMVVAMAITSFPLVRALGANRYIQTPILQPNWFHWRGSLYSGHVWRFVSVQQHYLHRGFRFPITQQQRSFRIWIWYVQWTETMKRAFIVYIC